MSIKEQYPALYAGLNQMPTDCIERCLGVMERHPERMLWDGHVSRGGGLDGY